MAEQGGANGGGGEVQLPETFDDPRVAGSDVAKGTCDNPACGAPATHTIVLTVSRAVKRGGIIRRVKRAYCERCGAGLFFRMSRAMR